MMEHHALLWYLQFKSGSTGDEHPGVYLLGTMHSSHPAALLHIPRVAHYIHRATHYYGETDLDSPVFQAGFEVTVPYSEKLDNLLISRLYDKGGKYLERHYGFNIDPLIHLPPMMISALIGERIIGAGSGLALDLQLWNIAKAHNLIMGGIESPVEQLNIYKRIPLDYQVDQLKNVLKHISKASKTLTSLSTAFAQQDLSALYRLSKSSLGPIRDMLLYERNQIMADRVMALANSPQQFSFVAVGAAHLPGVKGILRKLKKQGVSLKAIRL